MTLARRRALVTGFEPFGGDRTNPSQAIALAVDGRMIGGALVAGAVLPVDARRAVPALERAIAALGEPAAVICTGVAPGRPALALERLAVNLLAFETPDNAGTVERGRPIREHGEAARFTNLPLDPVLAAWRAAGIPGYVSDSAGTYLCNQVFYEVLALSSRSYPAGFIHVPCSPELALARGPEKTPSMSLDLMVRGVELALAAALAAGAPAAHAAPAATLPAMR